MDNDQPRRTCKANRSDGRPCKKPPVRGALVCATHGGAAPQVRAAAAKRESEAEIRRALARLDVAVVEDPLTELGRLAGQVVAWKDALAERVNELTSIRYAASGAGTEQLRSEVALFERAMDRCAAVLGLIAKLDIDQRLARITEQQADVVVRAVDARRVAAAQLRAAS